MTDFSYICTIAKADVLAFAAVCADEELALVGLQRVQDPVVVPDPPVPATTPDATIPDPGQVTPMAPATIATDSPLPQDTGVISAPITSENVPEPLTGPAPTPDIAAGVQLPIPAPEPALTPSDAQTIVSAPATVDPVPPPPAVPPAPDIPYGA